MPLHEMLILRATVAAPRPGSGRPCLPGIGSSSRRPAALSATAVILAEILAQRKAEMGAGIRPFKPRRSSDPDPVGTAKPRCRRSGGIRLSPSARERLPSASSVPVRPSRRDASSSDFSRSEE
jgi:hypothetical protein